MQTQREYGLRRVYESTPSAGGGMSIRLSDRMVDLGPKEWRLYCQVAEWIPSNRALDNLCAELGLDADGLDRLMARLKEGGLLYRRSELPATMTGLEFHARFNDVLASWLNEAFSHPFWERMMSGRGSRGLFVGWLIELYHYTKNANRHMPLACAHTREKPLKLLRAKHYAEEWNHYHYFMKSLKALGFTEEMVRDSVPLPTTLALSNFMRQAAREDVLCYSICSAVLEGTTTDRGTYNPYYTKCAELYDIPKEAIRPIYQHLDLDVQYQHSDLFLEILKNVPEVTQARATRILDYGHQLAETIWMWTQDIETYYDVAANPVPRRLFDPQLD